MEGETSKTQYKIVEYENTLYQIPIRYINQEYVLLLSDVQSILPKAIGFLSNTKLVPFQLDPNNQYTELIPKRTLISNNHYYYDEEDVWTVIIPSQESTSLVQSNIELQIKMDQLSQKLDCILSSLQLENETDTSILAAAADDNSITNTVNNATADTITNTEEQHENRVQLEQEQQGENEAGDHLENEDDNATEQGEQEEGEEEDRERGPPPAFSSSSSNHSQIASSAATAAASSSSRQQHEAPPSYETSVLSTIKSINSKLCLYESHIYNRHKSPKWLAKRQEWLSREPNSIEEVAYQLVQLEMALLWTAVSESWIQERETWLTLVASARSERHLAGAIINLERHTLVMDDDWVNIRERWINELLEMVVLPLSHG